VTIEAKELLALFKDHYPFTLESLFVQNSTGIWVVAEKGGDGVPVIDLGLGWQIPASVRAEVSCDQWPFTVTVSIHNSLAGSIVTEITVSAASGGSLSTTDLRIVAVDRVVYFAQVTVCAVFSFENDQSTADLAHLSGDAPSDHRMQRAAMAYRTATVMRRNATLDVASELGVSRATAGRVIRQCREAGLLGPALPKRAGEG
jgi:hypothetical protein